VPCAAAVQCSAQWQCIRCERQWMDLNPMWNWNIDLSQQSKTTWQSKVRCIWFQVIKTSAWSVVIWSHQPLTASTTLQILLNRPSLVCVCVCLCAYVCYCFIWALMPEIKVLIDWLYTDRIVISVYRSACYTVMLWTLNNTSRCLVTEIMLKTNSDNAMCFF